MALFKEKLPLSIRLTSDAERRVICNKVPKNVQMKVNRLKRAKKESKSPSLVNSCDLSFIRSSEAPDDDIKCLGAAETSIQNINNNKTGTQKQDRGHFSPPKESQRPDKLKPTLDDDVIDLCGEDDDCGDEGHTHSDAPTTLIRTRKHDPFSGLIPQTVKAEASYCGSFISEITLKNHRQKSGWRENFPEEACEKLLKKIQTQNQHFPVQRFFSQLQTRQSQIKPGLTSTTGFLHDVQPQHQRPHGGGVCVSVCECVNTPDPQQKPSSTHRLSVSRRKRHKHTHSAVSDQQMSVCESVCVSVCAEGENTPVECVESEDVLWTEKYQPRHSREIIGNSASIRKLHSWLQEWRMRADVEERRRRREERRRIQEESNESWDCGDFEGEVVVVDEEVQLCNTVLICGPTGSGKTAAVFACAHELGYKVLEVNSSSVRSAQLVLSQLREATQSHQVEALQPNKSTHPQNNLTCNQTAPADPTRASRQETSSRKLLTSSRKLLTSSRKLLTSSRKTPRKRSAAPALTLQHFFKRADQPVDQNPEIPQDTHDADKVDPDVYTESKVLCEDSVLNTADRHNRTPLISLILFEEVDIIFSEDVGFLTAVKTLMSTTKRPIILTTNDPLFSKRFNRHFETIHFKTPSLESSRSFLQCVCVVEGVWLDCEDVDVLLCECEGDVRRSVLQLEMWTRSGGGHTHRHTLRKTLSCDSWCELERSGLEDVLVEKWKKGWSFFYSNLELLFSPFSSLSSQNVEKNTLDINQKNQEEASSRPGKPSRLKVKKSVKPKRLRLDKVSQSQSSAKCTDQSEELSPEQTSSQLVSSCLNSLAQFFNTLSFLDSCVYKQLQGVGWYQADLLDWGGAGLMDSLVDEQREEDVNTHSDQSFEILAVLEVLQFLQCKAELSRTRRTAGELKQLIGGDRFTELMNHLIISDASKNKPSKQSIIQKKKREVINKVLSSKAFRCHGNKKAVAVDYLPALRSICRLETSEHQNKPRSLHYLTDIGLALSKHTLKLLGAATLT